MRSKHPLAVFRMIACISTAVIAGVTIWYTLMTKGILEKTKDAFIGEVFIRTVDLMRAEVENREREEYNKLMKHHWKALKTSFRVLDKEFEARLDKMMSAYLNTLEKLQEEESQKRDKSSNGRNYPDTSKEGT